MLPYVIPALPFCKYVALCYTRTASCKYVVLYYTCSAFSKYVPLCHTGLHCLQ